MRILSILLFITLSLSCDGSKKKFESKNSGFSGKIFGTYYNITINEPNINTEKLKAEVDLLLNSINKTFSTYIKDSELSKLNQAKANINVKLSNDMEKVLILSKKMFFETNGAFDPTVGPVVNRWGFGPDKDKNQPTKEEIKKLMINVGVKHFTLDKGYLSKKNSNLYIDLSAIAKGFAVDKVTDFLRKDKGFRNVLVEIGGEVRAHGNKGNRVWAIGIETPSGQLAAGIQKVVPLLNRSVATSGSYRNYLKYGDKVFSHTINPQTGMPVDHKLVSVTVIHPKCTEADAYATALMVMGPKKGLEYAQKKGLLAYFLVKTDNGFDEISSKAFVSYMKAFER